MSRYTFKCEHFDYSNPFNPEEKVASTHTVEFHADTLETMFEQFEMFLRGSGFHFDGQLDIVNDDEWTEETENEDSDDEPKQRWQATVHSLMNPPKFRANNCEVCGLDKPMMQRHNCYDDNCPVHAPKSIYTDGCESPSAGVK